MGRSSFAAENIEVRPGVHLNGGGQFNFTNYSLYYENNFIGLWSRGRRNKSEYFSEVKIDEEIFNLPEDKDKVIEATKKKFENITSKRDT